MQKMVIGFGLIVLGLVTISGSLIDAAFDGSDEPGPRPRVWIAAVVGILGLASGFWVSWSRIGR